MSSKHWMLWDGECGMCSATAQWVRKRDKKHEFQICQFQNCPTPPMNPALFERCKYELGLVTADGREMMGARAVLFILESTGWGWFAWMLSYPPFIWVLKVGYWIVARNRGLISKLFFGGKACGLENRYPEVDA